MLSVVRLPFQTNKAVLATYFDTLFFTAPRFKGGGRGEGGVANFD